MRKVIKFRRRSGVINFRRGMGFRAAALVRRLLLVVVLLTGLDVVHDGRVGWPGTLAPGLAASLAESAASARAWLEKSPAFCSACGDEAVSDSPVAMESAPTVAGAPAQRADPAPPAARPGAAERAAPAGDERAQAVEADLSGRVERVIDGDSLQVRIEGLGLIEVRLHGVDTPEYDQPYGSAAERELRRLVAWQRVELVSETVDSYGRLVATVYRGDVNVNREMVSRGYAWWYRRYARFDAALRRAEKEARAQRRGLWRDDDPMPPWDWRRK
jgi:endonuclease YncB( thermonuclease family)